MALSDDLLDTDDFSSVPANAGKGSNMRRDTRRNRRRLLSAMGHIVRDGDELTMQKVADRADIAIATAYRHFSSPEELIYAYVLAVVEDLADYSADSQVEGDEWLAGVLTHWIELIKTHGHVMVNHRSKIGFLQRLRSGDAIILKVDDAWRRPITQFMVANEIPPSETTQAVFLCNQMFDPREVLDQLDDPEMSQERLISYLLASYEGALRGWHSVNQAGELADLKP